MYISLCSALVLFFSYCQLSVKSGLGCSGPFYIMVSQSHLSSIHLFMHASTHPSVYPSMCPSICLCTCLSVHLSFHPAVCSSTCVTVPLSVSSCHHLIIQRPVVTLTVRPSGVVYLPTNSPSAFSGGSAKETGEGAENRFHFKLLKKWGMSFTLCSVSSSRFHRGGGGVGGGGAGMQWPCARAFSVSVLTQSQDKKHTRNWRRMVHGTVVNTSVKLADYCTSGYCHQHQHFHTKKCLG